ncbi:hypothetical protein H112_04964 [Trichophyton rubrum D6]|uniref:Uncharacterized protein n=3 Tax=Trichophyton TaxID=5550 RepID=A0A080WJR0_TRIRC|nr:uncharacterized protein TERG_11889 [Trichophyton rubrum CBS 118892]EZF22112.1 hypothetical protein H100_04986 [Trichophyton rubrum MR850]EZF41151.1 hypothetical protein H102_04973 [Trichophyton rubrum CBS 100081]EZF51820.1 hypothetical protein H103_04975 [Trichophyton rubrum CBS 288.86]EZF62349.1 hypothetical protein H104_04967 [Trichophyton rubrum CBS 289.86]EZF73038.1 hypothetical protein H105_04993 [Trichophyton soudanense CBS 452.61]EZF83723.1 hypothetical protein H110_04973 [Trichophy
MSLVIVPCEGPLDELTTDKPIVLANICIAYPGGRGGGQAIIERSGRTKISHFANTVMRCSCLAGSRLEVRSSGCDVLTNLEAGSAACFSHETAARLGALDDHANLLGFFCGKQGNPRSSDEEDEYR